MNDTDSKAAAFQLNLIKNADSQARFHATRSMSETMIRFSRAAIQKAHPHLSVSELNFKFISLHYGEALADQVQEFLKHRRNT